MGAWRLGGWRWAALAFAGLLIATATGGRERPAFAGAPIVWAAAAPAATTASMGTHLGVGSCAGSTCHGRQEATGAVVRQDELRHWQDPASPAGAHSRAWRVLGNARSRNMAARLGISDPQKAAQCLGCHAEPQTVRVADGIGCEGCHGGAAGWLAIHKATGASHARNVAAGMVALEDPRVRAARCLDCHLGSDRAGQFVDHRIYAAGHPRLQFELDLFSSLNSHWNEDADYRARKGTPSGVRTWAVGQAMAVSRALTVYGGPRGVNGAFPELTFFDCQSCHRRISDDPDFRPMGLRNPGRPGQAGMPAFQDENIIMLLAAARVAAPGEAAQFDAAAKGFHAALQQGRMQAVAAAARLRGAADGLADGLARASFGKAEALAMVAAVATGAADRYTDYEASVQGVMALDTLLSALVRQGSISEARAAAIRPDIDRAYAAVRDANGYKPLDFRAALARAATAIRAAA